MIVLPLLVPKSPLQSAVWDDQIIPIVCRTPSAAENVMYRVCHSREREGNCGGIMLFESSLSALDCFQEIHKSLFLM